MSHWARTIPIGTSSGSHAEDAPKSSTICIIVRACTQGSDISLALSVVVRVLRAPPHSTKGAGRLRAVRCCRRDGKLLSCWARRFARALFPSGPTTELAVTPQEVAELRVIGNLSDNVELCYSEQGDPVAKMTVAVSRRVGRNGPVSQSRQTGSSPHRVRTAGRARRQQRRQGQPSDGHRPLGVGCLGQETVPRIVPIRWRRPVGVIPMSTRPVSAERLPL